MKKKQKKNLMLKATNPVSILYKSIAGRYRPVSYPDGPITARYRFIKNAYWESVSTTEENLHKGAPINCIVLVLDGK